jgi:hypothetical protein
MMATFDPAPHRDALLARALPDGSFAVSPGSASRPDATAWATVALHAMGTNPAACVAARTALAGLQRPDGSVPVVPERPAATWPTALALLAWLPDPAFATQAKAAAQWLLTHTGRHWPKQDNAITAHDPSIKGWAWINDTHSWVEPTAQAMLSLGVMGLGHSPRVAEAARMLLDRQLPDGGWNYGNTRVFRNTLLPIPECSGHALAALAGRADRAAVDVSLGYLAGPECAVATPLAATWRAFGLTAWQAAPDNTLPLLATTLDRQSRYGPYDTPLLAQVLAALASGGRFAALVGEEREEKMPPAAGVDHPPRTPWKGGGL